MSLKNEVELPNEIIFNLLPEIFLTYISPMDFVKVLTANIVLFIEIPLMIQLFSLLIIRALCRLCIWSLICPLGLALNFEKN